MPNRTAHTLSHWWGFATMPEGMEYPSNGEDNPLTLVCQFKHDGGLVYVLADLDYFFGNVDAESGHLGEWDEAFYRVLYAADTGALHEHEIRYPDGRSAVPDPEPIEAPAERGELSAVRSGAGCFQDEIAQDYPGYEVLVELDENDKIGLRFYDCGNLFFLIRPEDLAAKRFDRVKCVLYSY